MGVKCWLEHIRGNERLSWWVKEDTKQTIFFSFFLFFLGRRKSETPQRECNQLPKQKPDSGTDLLKGLIVCENLRFLCPHFLYLYHRGGFMFAGCTCVHIIEKLEGKNVFKFGMNIQSKSRINWSDPVSGRGCCDSVPCHYNVMLSKQVTTSQRLVILQITFKT